MPCTVVVGLQWGDEGKGKIIDVLSAHADVVVRYQGGGNAGHTVECDGGKYVLHHLPSGILREGTRNVIGAGCVVDPKVLLEEIANLEAAGKPVDGRLILSERAHLVLPGHRLWDQMREKAGGGVGTTGRGIGPCYADKAARIGVRAGDWRVSAHFEQRLRANLEEKNVILKAMYDAEPMDIDAILAEYLEYGRQLMPILGEAETLVRKALSDGERVLGEGAQGVLLDLDHGSYPFVTSSSSAPGGVGPGSGMSPRAPEKVIGVAKAYLTRVGEGPFPTELDDDMGRRLRDVGKEYGSTTGRPRRCGWFDAVAARYAVELGGIDQLTITKMDILSGIETLRVCVGYEVDGERYDTVPASAARLERAVPVYRDLPGWSEDIVGATVESDLPADCRAYLEAIEQEVGVPVRYVSVGPDRAQTLKRGLVPTA
jgi:adenylosuccinate synthase